MPHDKGSQIIDKAKSLGASLAGIASVKQLKESPSYMFNEKISKGLDGGAPEGYSGDIIKWPENAKSILVIALSHPRDNPELDWWCDTKYKTPGNLCLHEINLELSLWIEKEYALNTHLIPYGLWDGGIYLKDAAVLAGLGCIGKNNLLITPQFGPKVRLRAIFLDNELPQTGPITYDPCKDCDEFCHKACPQQVFGEAAISPDKIGLSVLPARLGNYSRVKCYVQGGIYSKESGIDFRGGLFWSEVAWDKEIGKYQKDKYLTTCRYCEYSCPVGN